MSFWKIKASANRTPELEIYGVIGEWDDVSARDFADQLKAITAPEIHVFINSPGGEVWAASAIYTMLRRHKAKITVFIDGIAASAATVIAMAGDKIIMPANSMMMIHNPLTMVWGNANEMRDTADMLDKVRKSMLSAYQEKSGLEESIIIEIMDAETWFTATEAVEWGFADEIEDAKRIAASATGAGFIVNGQSFDLSAYKNAAPALDKMIAAASATDNQPATATAGDNSNTETAMTLDELKANHPEVYAAAVSEGKTQAHAETGDDIKARIEQAELHARQSERARIKAIEDVAVPGYEALVVEAKFDTGVTAEVLAMSIVKAEKAQGANFLAQRAQDATAVQVPVASNLGNQPLEADKAAERKTVAQGIAAGMRNKSV